jgi:hypothetical protein
MAYKYFKWKTLKSEFGIDRKRKNLFDQADITLLPPSKLLVDILKRNALIPSATEKAMSENTIYNVLAEVKINNQDQIGLLSGEILNADIKRKLNGEVDFLFMNVPTEPALNAPIISITESKFKQPFDSSWEQATAQMVGARVYNQKEGEPIDTIYGAVTDGNSWRFLLLKEQTIWIDLDLYSTNNLPLLLGVFQKVVDFYR